MNSGGAIALASMAVVAAGCGSGASGTTTISKAHTARAVKRTQRKRSAATVGATQPVYVRSSRLSVRVSKVIDPLRDSGAALPPGERAVGALVRILNHGPAVYDSSSTTDISLTSSKGAGTPVFAPRGVCTTPLRNWDT